MFFYNLQYKEIFFIFFKRIKEITDKIKVQCIEPINIKYKLNIRYMNMILKKVLFILLILTVFFQINIPKENDSTTIRVENTLNKDYNQYNIPLTELTVNQNINHFLIIIPEVFTSGTYFLE